MPANVGSKRPVRHAYEPLPAHVCDAASATAVPNIRDASTTDFGHAMVTKLSSVRHCDLPRVARFTAEVCRFSLPQWPIGSTQRPIRVQPASRPTSTHIGIPRPLLPNDDDVRCSNESDETVPFVIMELRVVPNFR